MLHIFVIILSSAMLFSTPADARKMSPSGCTDKVTASVNINIRDRASTLTEAKAMFDQKVVNVHAMAKQAGIDELHVQSMNYNINPNQQYDNHGGGYTVSSYNVSGNINTQLDSEQQAMQFSEFLAEKKIYASVNMNSYKQGNCNR